MNKTGRPKGSKNVLGMTLEKRIKILTKLALDNNVKPSDRISAISQITSLLNDKVKDSSEGSVETVLKFENSSKPVEKVEKEVEKKTEIIPVITVEPSTTTTTTTTVIKTEEPKQEQVTNFSIPLVIKNE